LSFLSLHRHSSTYALEDVDCGVTYSLGKCIVRALVRNDKLNYHNSVPVADASLSWFLTGGPSAFFFSVIVSSGLN
jgi:hypothetical protein